MIFRINPKLRPKQDGITAEVRKQNQTICSPHSSEHPLLSKSSLPSVSVNLSGADCACMFVIKQSEQETIFKSELSTRLTEYGEEVLCTGVLITFD